MQGHKLPGRIRHACAARDSSDIVSGACRGFAAASAQVAYYAAPLSTLLKVVRQRSSASLHFPLCLANAINVACWLSYGVVRRPPATSTHDLKAPHGQALHGELCRIVASLQVTLHSTFGS